MASLAAVVAAVVLVAGVAAGATKFDDVVQPSWANDHMVYDGDLLKLRLDSNSGSSQTHFLRLASLQRDFLFPFCY